MAEDRDSGFFIGWAPPPPGLRRFLVACGAVLILGFGLAGYLLAVTADDPGDGAFRFDWGEQTIVGRLEALPYPVVHVIEAERYPPGTPVMLSGVGKRGVQDRADPLDGRVVEVRGIALKRGDLDMLQVAGGEAALAPVDDAVPDAPAPQDLGRWRLTGEICDGKCYAGAMRPGEGLAHRACANLCLVGGVPLVFVSTGPVDGAEFFLMADAGGGPVTGAVLDHVATLVEIEGTVERRGGLAVFRIDPDTIRLAR